jgi:hypothetical protein
MKQTVWLLLAVMGSAMMLYADDANKGTATMTGWICDSKCVVQRAGQSSCNKKCSEQSGEYVFVTDQNLLKISTQDMVKTLRGKHVKVTCAPSKDQPNMMDVQNIVEYGGGG